MKKLLFLSVFCFQFSGSAQIADWYKVDLSRLGYKHTKFVFEEYPSSPYSALPITKLEVKGGSIELSADIYTKHVYFGIDGSSILDVGVTLFQFNKSKQRWWSNDDYYVLRSDILPVRLAFGSNIGKYVGLYAGGQYSLSSVGLNYRSNNSDYRDTRISGNTYGFGGHLVAAYKLINVRYSYMYNWQAQAKRFKGNAIMNELVISIGNAQVGGFAKFTHLFNVSREGYLPKDRTKLFASSYPDGGKDFSWQSSQYATQFQFSVGIYAAGLFSGVTKAGSNALLETEQGLAKERRDDKRRKIEYKER
jgi:hypothetical protein